MDAFKPIPFQRPTGVGNQPSQRLPTNDRSYPAFLSGNPPVWGRPDRGKSVRSRIVSGLDAVKKQMSVVKLSMQHLRKLEGNVTTNADKINASAIVDELLENLDRLSETASAQVNGLFNIVRNRKAGEASERPITRPNLDEVKGSGIWQHLNTLKENLYLLRDEFQAKELCHERQSHLIDQAAESVTELSRQTDQLEVTLKTVRCTGSRPITRSTVVKALTVWTKTGKSEPGFLKKSVLFLKRIPLKLMELLALPFTLADKVSSLAIVIFDGAYCCLSRDPRSQTLETKLRTEELEKSRQDPVQRTRRVVTDFTKRAQKTLTPKKGSKRSESHVHEQKYQNLQRQQSMHRETELARESFERRLQRPEPETSEQSIASLTATKEKVEIQHREAVLRSQSSDYKDPVQEKEIAVLEELSWRLDEELTAAIPAQSGINPGSYQQRIEVINGEITHLLFCMKNESDLFDVETRLDALAMRLADIKGAVFQENEEMFDGELQEHYQEVLGKIRNGRASLKEQWLTIRNQGSQACLRQIGINLKRLKRELIEEGASRVRIDAIDKVLDHLRTASTEQSFWPRLNKLLHGKGSLLYREVYRNIGTVDAQAETVCKAELNRLEPLRALNDYMSPQTLITAAKNFIANLPAPLTREQVLIDYPEVVALSECAQEEALSEEQGEALEKVRLSSSLYLNKHMEALKQNQIVSWSNPGRAAMIRLLINGFAHAEQVKVVLEQCPASEIPRVFSHSINDWLEDNEEQKETDFYKAMKQAVHAPVNDLSFKTFLKEVRMKMNRPLTIAEKQELEVGYCRAIERVNEGITQSFDQ
ncbi:hypothetical protein EOPP23_12460 [Endozoicomonas sp. OPT23]|uniref:hypothetical protein n=1 Tax=Endozoicomonas sp. OPT23 TaxID=2072845 RepID=UPI00129B0296|nr:hypothetical protein [Endozoicomonas sp. OPT23]MRI33798.1 hypothetical protein [Endozoicomonas sp. OPT23]